MARFRGNSSWRRRLPHLIWVCLFSIFVCAALDVPENSGPGGTTLAALSYFEQYAYSVRMIIFSKYRNDLYDKVKNKIVLVTMADSTFKELPGPPLPRRYHAKVIRELTKAGAKVIAFDILFDQENKNDPQGDQDMAKAARESGRVLWAAVASNDDVNPDAQANSIATGDGLPVLTSPIELFRKASPYVGHINASDLELKQLEQPVVDRLKSEIDTQNGPVLSFSLMAARMATGNTRKAPDVLPSLYSTPGTVLPTDAGHNFKITFFGGGGHVFTEIPYEVVYRGEAQKQFYREHLFFHKIVIIGDDTTFGNDHRYTPVGEMSGVEIHAQAIATLLLGSFIKEAPPWVSIALIAFMGAIVCPLAAAQRLQWIVLGVFCLLSFYFLFNVWIFVQYGWWLHLIGPSASLVMATILMLIERGLFEEREKEHMFDALVTAAGSAIERRDPSTSGHSQRVTALTIALAEAVTEQKKGPFRNVRFSTTQIKELRYAGLLHDFGKIGVRENVLIKSHKLDPRHFEAVVSRLLVSRQAMALEYAQRQLAALKNETDETARTTVEALEQELQGKLAQLDEDIVMLEKSNDPMVTYLPDEQYQQLQLLLGRLEKMSFRDASGALKPIVTYEERSALSIRKGSLTPDEYREVQKHAALSFDFLEQIPWTDSLSNIPDIARSHHEKLNGTGYPRGLKQEDISIQARMMTIADIYDALTAADRPYKKAMPVDKALQILLSEANQGALDMDLLTLFINEKVHKVTEDWNYATPPMADVAAGAHIYAT